MRHINYFTEKFTLEVWYYFTKLNPSLLPHTTVGYSALALAWDGVGTQLPRAQPRSVLPARVPGAYSRFSVTCPGAGADHSVLAPQETRM